MNTCKQKSMHRAIVVDDSRYSSVAIKKALREFDIDVIDIAFSVVDFEAFLEGVEKPDVVTMDMVLPDGNGIECCEILWRKWPNVPVIFISAAPLNEEQKTRLPNVIDFIIKPLNIEKLGMALSKYVFN